MPICFSMRKFKQLKIYLCFLQHLRPEILQGKTKKFSYKPWLHYNDLPVITFIVYTLILTILSVSIVFCVCPNVQAAK